MSQSNKSAQNITAAHRDPSHPQHSCFVYANAGSGKTRQLTQRIIRLLLSGVNPAKILALTYTKTAAATMAERVFAKLASFVALDDEALRKEIIAMEEPPPSQVDLRTARRLFARAVETPGGLKIQTIHAFCERVLQLFPFEANVPASFRVIDESEEARLVQQAQTIFFDRFNNEKNLTRELALKLVVEEVGSQFDTLIDEALKKYRLIWQQDLVTRTPDDFGRDLTHKLLRREGLSDNLDSLSVAQMAVRNNFTLSEWREIANLLKTGSTNDQKRATIIFNNLTQLETATAVKQCEALANILLTQKYELPKGKFYTKAISTKAPDICARLDAVQQDFFQHWQTLCIVKQCERSGALGTLAYALQHHYDALKAEQGVLDFDDLIFKTANLLRDTNAAFVLYKLDQGIDHILLDEAQDTAKEQWQILDSLSGEFGAGAGARPQTRTLFAVGDEKQSIYGFRGAVPAMFANQRQHFADKLGVDSENFRVQLRVSYRSSQTILKAVDTVFSLPENFSGLSADADITTTQHEPHRRNLPGLVEVWPLIMPPAQENHDDNHWALQANLEQENPIVTLATRIAQLVKDLLDPAKGHRVHDRGDLQDERPRAIHAGDILILMRSRSALFEAVIRMLKEFDIAVAGADRLNLTNHIAVEDLLALGRACLLPHNDVALASVLKSPLFHLDDDDLLRLAIHRTGTLEEALAASKHARDQYASMQFQTWRALALRETPFTFYNSVLASASGRRAYRARLGPEVDDVLSEFLNKALHHGTQDIPSLTRFIEAFEKDDSTIKRDFELTPNLLRVMTVHAAKGMEAKIVILPDTVNRSEPGSRHTPKLWDIQTDKDAPLIAWSTGKPQESPCVKEARAQHLKAAQEEHRRLLYVALTRAEERLYICGVASKKMNEAHSWYSMVSKALLATGALQEVPAFWSASDKVLRYGDGGNDLSKSAFTKADETVVNNSVMPNIPTWLWQEAVYETNPPPPLRPSNALSAADSAEDFVLFGLPDYAPNLLRDDDDAQEAKGEPSHSNTPAKSIIPSAYAAQQFGTLFHALVAKLASVDETARAKSLTAFCEKDETLEATMREALANQIQAFFNHAPMQDFINANTQFELPIAGSLPFDDDDGAHIIPLAGRIDGLVINETTLFLCDIKTGSRTPKKRQQALAQLALYEALLARIYPHHTIETAILWASLPHAERLEKSALSAACQHILQGRAPRPRSKAALHKFVNIA